MEIGLIGLPNVGKSTLFTALTEKEVEAKNYPFTTVESNVGVIKIKDDRLTELCQFYQPEKCRAAFVKFVDIAGLVEGASQGEGLGNQFLANIREVDALAHVVRLFADENIAHVAGDISPLRDIKIIERELIAADLQTIEKRLEKTINMQKTGDKKYFAEEEALKNIEEKLADDIPIRRQNLSQLQERLVAELFLLTAKPLLYLGNINKQKENSKEEFRAHLENHQEQYLFLDVLFEEELMQLSPEERALFREDREGDNIDSLIKASKDLLDLITFFTVAGGKEVRATNVPRGTLAPAAAGKIHSQMEEGFIKAEVINYAQWAQFSDLEEAKRAGEVEVVGRDYKIKDGDICYFHFSD